MKIGKVILSLAIALVVGFSCASLPAQNSSPAEGASVASFLGRWDLTVKSADREYPSWIEIQEKDGQLSAQFVGRWGNARPLPKIEVHGAHITFVSPKEEEGSKEDMVYQGTLTGKTLSGSTNGADGTPWKWSGVRAPSLKRAKAPEWGEPIHLFNGKDLTGWKMDKPGPPEWTVKDGNLVSPGNGPELVNEHKFQDFKLHVEFNCHKDSNSGVYLRGRYETQVETESAGEPPSHHTGGIYGFLAPTPEQPRTPDVWQTFDITLIGRRVTVVLNGQTVIDNQEIPGITGGAVDSHEEMPGPIFVQGGEKGHVEYRNIIVTPAK